VKILVAGDWRSELHEEAVFSAFTQLGHEPLKFSWNQYFKKEGWLKRLATPVYKAQNKYLAGPAVAQLNKDMLALGLKIRPDMIFIYRGSHIYANTIKKLRSVLEKTKIVGYNNDDPFSPQYPDWAWRHFLESVPEYDLILAYRHRNIDEYLQAGAKQVELLRSWFIPEKNYPVSLTDEERKRFGCDVVFVGHYEDDGRQGQLEEIVKSGLNLRLFGPEWEKVTSKSKELSKLTPVRAVRGDEYNKALNASKIALCFLSKLNRDTYTRRCFEIPATNTLMLAEYSDDLASLFAEGQEADFFRNTDELLRKIEVYLKDDSRRRMVANAGYERVTKDGHDVVSRMQQVIGWCVNSE